MIDIDSLNAALDGRYRIERELGAGGMATVLLADDLRHERKVALKVLNPELAAVVGAERFLAEIKTTANLQHAHILPLFDSGEAASFLFYVMPYVEGESLRERLDRERQLPVAEAIAIATDVAEALDYAHRQGVIHRDVKPANILLRDGEAFVSDFGIALALRAGGGGRLTETGLTPGTPQYMSPEQATGDQAVGPSSDIYSLGCVLYEMLVGEAPFTGSTPQAILGKIIAGEPSAAGDHRGSVPANVDAAIAAALEKVPADRPATAGEFARALDDPGFRHGDTSQPAEAAAGSGRSAAWAVGAAALFAVLGAWGWMRQAADGPASARVSRLNISLTGDHRLAIGSYESFPLALSPDGGLLAYVGESQSGTQLYLRALGAFDPVPLDGTAAARQPFFSPDGQSVGYFTRQGLYRVSVDGGAPIRIAPMPLRPETATPISPAGAAWGENDVIVIASGETDLWTVAVSGGDVRAVPLHYAGSPETEPMQLEGNRGVRWPSFLPAEDSGGRRLVLVTIDNELFAVSLSDGSAQPLQVGGGGRGIYAPTGHLIATMTSGEARLVPFDLAGLEPTGPAEPFLDDVYRPTATAATVLALSQNGTLAYVAGGAERTLVRVDRRGHPTALPFPARAYRFPRVSPSGELLAVDDRSEGVWIFNLATGAAGTFPGGAVGPWLSEDEVVHSLGDAGLYRTRVTAGATPEPIPGVPDSMFLRDILPNGRVLLNRAFGRRGSEGGVYVWALGSDQPPVPFVDGPAHESSGRVSPDGSLATFISDVTGRMEVYVQAFDGSGDPVLVSVQGGREPVWSPDGREILFWNAERLMSVRLLSTRPLRVAAPELLFEGAYYLQEPGTWDVTPDGDFILISAGRNWLREIRVVQNVFEELR